MQSLKAYFAKLDRAHWILLFVFIATVAVPDLVNLENALGLGKAVAVTLKLGSYLSFVLGLLKQFAPTEAKTASDMIQGQLSKLPPLGVLMLVALVVAAVGCGAGQILGPDSKLPADLEKDAQCVTTQLENGNSDPVKIAFNCSLQEGATLTDLIAFLVNKLGDKVPKATRTAMGSYIASRRAAGDQ